MGALRAEPRLHASRRNSAAAAGFHARHVRTAGTDLLPAPAERRAILELACGFDGAGIAGSGAAMYSETFAMTRGDAREVFVISAVRTAIGSFGGTLKDTPAVDLATLVIREAVRRSSVTPDSVGHVSLGTVILTEPRDVYMSRIAALGAGLPEEVAAFNVNRLCGSGLQAIISSAQSLLLGDCDVAVAAGAESMSRAGYLAPAARWGSRIGDAALLDLMLTALHDPMHRIHMGITAENVAEQYAITRQMMDGLAVTSHRRAAAAIAAGHFREQIVPVEITTRNGAVLFDVDEHVKPNTNLEVLSKMKPAFKKVG